MKTSMKLLVLLLVLSVPLSAQKPNRSKLPELGPTPSLQLPPIQHFTLSDSCVVVVLEKHQVPLVQINLIVRVGSVNDPANKQGLADMTAAMLDEGAGSRNALELADAIDFLGASITTSAGYHTSTVSLQTPLSKLDSAVELFADIALRPAFPANELERIRKEKLTALMQAHDQPRTIASVGIVQVIFGVEHPYGKHSLGTEAALKSFTADDLKNFYTTNFRPNNAVFVVVGDVNAKEIVAKFNTLFAEWQAKTVSVATVPIAPEVKERNVIIVDKPEAPQSEIRIGKLGAQRLTEDYFPLLVMNTLLGGSFSSRLNQNLREQHGYTYGAGSSFDFRPSPGPFIAASAVQTEVTDKALTEFMKELRGIAEPVSDEELKRAKNYLALGYPDNFQSVAQIAMQLNNLVIYNLPDDYFNKYIERVLAVTKADVQRVAKKYLNLDKLSIVIVGDRAKIEKGVNNLKLGPTKVLKIEDVLGKSPKM